MFSGVCRGTSCSQWLKLTQNASDLARQEPTVIEKIDETIEIIDFTNRSVCTSILFRSTDLTDQPERSLIYE